MASEQTFLNGVVPCKQIKCPNFATVFAVLGNGTFKSGFYCDKHFPEGWKIQQGSLGSANTDILRNHNR